MSTQTQTVTLKGFGPHVRFTTSKAGTVKVVTKDSVKTVPLVKTTDVNFAA